jgi:hypothetical protein
MRPSLARLLPAALCAGILIASGCGKLLGPKTGEPLPSYPDGPAGLQAMFNEVLTAAKRDERERVHQYFAALKMTPAELGQLFGPQSKQLEKPYDDMMATLMHRGAVELVAVVYEKKYDTVEIIPVTLPPPDAAVSTAPLQPGAKPEEVALAKALIAHPQLYAVRFKKDKEALGTRYDFMFYTDGHWRTGNQLGKLLARRAAELTAAPPAR